MALEGTIATPFGHIPKKGAAIGAGIIVLAIGIGYYRSKKNQQAAAAAATDPNSGQIDPATGFVYGTPEDQAALVAQGAAGIPGTVGSSGGVSIPSIGTLTTTGPFSTNAQWVQAVETYFQQNVPGTDPQLLSAAMGVYITGQEVPDDATISLIEQAIAAEGFPPAAGANGQPPGINTNNPTPTPTPTPTPIPTPTPTPTPVSSAPKIGDLVKTHATKDAQNGVTLNLSIINDGHSVFSQVNSRGNAVLTKGGVVRCAVPVSSLYKA